MNATVLPKEHRDYVSGAAMLVGGEVEGWDNMSKHYFPHTCPSTAASTCTRPPLRAVI